MVSAELSGDKWPFAMWKLREGTQELHWRHGIEQIVRRKKRKALFLTMFLALKHKSPPYKILIHLAL